MTALYYIFKFLSNQLCTGIAEACLFLTYFGYSDKLVLINNALMSVNLINKYPSYFDISLSPRQLPASPDGLKK